jgi:hypothetical protein
MLNKAKLLKVCHTLLVCLSTRLTWNFEETSINNKLLCYNHMSTKLRNVEAVRTDCSTNATETGKQPVRLRTHSASAFQPVVRGRPSGVVWRFWELYSSPHHSIIKMLIALLKLFKRTWSIYKVKLEMYRVYLVIHVNVLFDSVVPEEKNVEKHCSKWCKNMCAQPLQKTNGNNSKRSPPYHISKRVDNNFFICFTGRRHLWWMTHSEENLAVTSQLRRKSWLFYVPLQNCQLSAHRRARASASSTANHTRSVLKYNFITASTQYTGRSASPHEFMTASTQYTGRSASPQE